MNKSELPAAIADLLLISEDPADPWVSIGDTVNASWHRAVGEALDVPFVGGKVVHMQSMLTEVGVQWDAARHSSEQTVSKGGGNLRKEAYEDLLATFDSSPRAKAALQLAKPNNPLAVFEGPLERVVVKSIRERRGQPQFRAAMLAAYGGRCAVTRASVATVLEAAHIRPFSEGGRPVETNGILLRSDIHTLFDLGQLGVSAVGRVVLAPDLLTTDYGYLHGQDLVLPSNPNLWPDAAQLEQHRLRWRL